MRDSQRDDSVSNGPEPVNPMRPANAIIAL